MQELLLLINSIRTQPLVIDKSLTKIAEVRCINMKEWSHAGFPSKQINKKYYYAGENLALDFTDNKLMFTALQNSPTHNANMIEKNYQKIGIAKCKNKLGNTTVMLFGGI